MTAHSLPVLAMASIVLYVGVYHAYLCLRGQGKRRDFTFALACFGVVVYDAFCIGLYNASSTAEGIEWQRLQGAALSVLGAAYLWFLLDYSETKPGKTVYALTAYLVLSAFVQFLVRSPLTWSLEPSVKRFWFPLWQDPIVYYEHLPGPLTVPLQIVGLGITLYGLWLSIRMLREGERRRARPLCIAMVLFLVGYANDVAVSLGLHHSLYVIEYAYLGLVILMANTLSEELAEAGRTRRDLLDSERRFAAIFNQASQLTGMLSPQGSVLVANATSLDFIDRDLADVQGKPFWDTPWWEQSETTRTMLRNAVASAAEGEFVRFEAININRDGEERSIDFSLKPVFDDDGNVVYLIAEGRDITDRHHALQEIRESREQYQALFESASDAIFLTRGDKFVDCNPMTLQVFGCAREDIVGQPPYRFSPPRQPDGRDSREKALEKIQLALDGQPQVFDWQHTRLSGEPFDAEVSLTRVEIREQPHLLAIVRDVTERKRAERALRQSEETVRALVDTSQDWIWAIDLNGVHTYSNPAVEMILGYRVDELVGRECWAMIFEDDRKRVTNRLRESVRRRTGWRNLLLRWLHRDGSIRYLEGSAVPIFDEAGDLVGFRGVDRDVTDRVDAERERENLGAQLRQAQKMEAIGTLAGGIAHDFNNILSAIIGFAELAQYGAGDPEHVRENLSQVLNAGARAKDLISQILAFSRQSEQEKKPLRLQAVVEDAAKLLRASVPATIEFRVSVDEACPPVTADPTSLHQIIMNLCTNAYQAMSDAAAADAPSHEECVLGLELESFEVSKEQADELLHMKPGLCARLTVSDTGPGMDSRTQERIFEPYFTTKEPGKGTGLGLATVHSIVQSHGGAIRVHSEPGQGTVFHIYLPSCPAKQVPEATTGTREEAPLGTERVLFVDDEPALTELAEKALAVFGYNIATCSNGPEALAMFSKDPAAFDVVISDMTMPAMNGLELATRLFALRPDLPVILCTGFTEATAKEKALALGIRQFVLKPVVGSQLAHAIRAAIDGNGPQK